MYISELRKILNYRNLSNKRVLFDDNINFLVGENNIGKTNLLELLNIILHQGSFRENDFKSILEPITIVFTIKYSEEELGFFENNFDVEDEFAITIIAEQKTVDDKIEYFHDVPNKTPISIGVIRKLNTLYYFAQRVPSRELDFRNNRGTGKILSYLIQHSLSKNHILEKDILKKGKLKNVVNDINTQIENLNSLTGDTVKAYVDENPEKIIGRLLALGNEEERELGNLGQGVQYAFNLFLQILENIYSVKNSLKEDDFESRIISKNNKRFFPILLILDEPEIHQHPYRQRSLVRKIQELMGNENIIFSELIKELFSIDGLIGQVFIATHSPNILLNDYHQFIRFYIDGKGKNQDLSIISGKELELDHKLHKHLLRSYINIKECMFSRAVVFVEGDTENGAIPVFSQRMNLQLDDRGIGIVKLDGVDSVENCKKLCEQFGIKAYAVIDKDAKDRYSHLEDVYFTDKNDFEEDVYDSFELNDYLMLNMELGNIDYFIGVMKRYGFLEDTDKIREFRTNPSCCEIDTEVGKNILKDIRVDELEKLKNSKNALKAALLALYVTQIPKSFQKVIKKLDKEVP